MSLKKYLFLMIFATLLSWGGWMLILFFVNPYEAGMVGLILFYGALCLGLSGIFSIVGFIIRYLIKRNEFVYNQVKIAFRQGVIFGILIVAALYLQSIRLLVWWNLMLLILLVSFVEYGFLLKNPKGGEGV